MILANKNRPKHSECHWGCCTDIHGRNVKKARRMMKRRERNNWKKDI